MKRVLMCDFETTIGDRTNVWLWGSYDILTDEFIYDVDIESFIDFVHEDNSRIYFHNLKFDGMFLLDYYLKNGYTWVNDDKKQQKGTIKTVISDKGQFYKIVVCTSKNKKIEYRDSYKIISLAVEDIPKAFGLPLQKLYMDYVAHSYGEPNIPTSDDIKYLYHDCKIVALALKIMMEQHMDNLTTGSNALKWFKEHEEKYDKYFPQLTPEEDSDIRKAYKGAWCYANPKYQKQLVGEGRVYDVNSMYPWSMRDNLMPIGKPVYFKGKYKWDKAFPLWVACIRMDLSLKDGKYPCLQLKNNPLYIETEYIIKTGEPTYFYLTNVDYELVIDLYDIHYEEWIMGYKFMARDDVFDFYVNYWYGQKEEHTKEKNQGLRTIDKFMLNTLYGKFGSNPIKDIKQPYIEDDMVKFKRVEMPKKYDGYVPIAAFITAYCRDKIIRDANKAGDRFLYADTDSLHVLGDYDLEIDVDNYRLGAYKHESTFSKAKYYRAKMYIETIDGIEEKKAGGLPPSARGNFTYETMVEGAEFGGKLMPKVVPGGVVLVERTFKIRG